MKTLPISGTDVSEITPIGGVLHVAGLVRRPTDKVSIRWQVDGSSGRTECEAWRGQYEIDGLARAGYEIKGVSLA
jgi:hypothetical protein